MSKDGEENNQPARPRRASFAELFASRPLIDSLSANTDVSRPHAASMAAVTQQAQQQSRTRRLSITALGLSASPTNTQPAIPFGSLKRGSVAAATGRRGSIDMMNENAVDDEEPGPLMSAGAVPGRRLSFGAKAYRDLRTSGASGTISETSPPASATSKVHPPPGSSKGVDGFNWSENLRAKAKRSSISAASPNTGIGAALSPTATHKRSGSTASTQASTTPPQPKAPPKAPDHFQERILKGDFYMD